MSADPVDSREADLIRRQALVDLAQAMSDRNQKKLDREQARGDAAAIRASRERSESTGGYDDLFDLEEDSRRRAQDEIDDEQAAQDGAQHRIDGAQRVLDRGWGVHDLEHGVTGHPAQLTRDQAFADRAAERSARTEAGAARIAVRDEEAVKP